MAKNTGYKRLGKERNKIIKITTNLYGTNRLLILPFYKRQLKPLSILIFTSCDHNTVGKVLYCWRTTVNTSMRIIRKPSTEKLFKVFPKAISSKPTYYHWKKNMKSLLSYTLLTLGHIITILHRLAGWFGWCDGIVATTSWILFPRAADLLVKRRKLLVKTHKIKWISSQSLFASSVQFHIHTVALKLFCIKKC